jgi:hypothetical protein
VHITHILNQKFDSDGRGVDGVEHCRNGETMAIVCQVQTTHPMSSLLTLIFTLIRFTTFLNEESKKTVSKDSWRQLLQFAHDYPENVDNVLLLFVVSDQC